MVKMILGDANSVVNSLKYFYFGRAYCIMSSKCGNKKKLLKMRELRRELHSDKFVNSSPFFDQLIEEIDTILLDKEKFLDEIISLKKFKLPLFFVGKNLNCRGY